MGGWSGARRTGADGGTGASLATPSSSRIRAAVLTGGLLALVGTMIVAGPADAATNGSLALRTGYSTAVTVSEAVLGNVTASASFNVPEQRSTYLAVQMRSTDPGSGYRAKVRIQDAGEVSVGIVRVVGGVETTLASGSTSLAVSTGQQLRIEGVVAGTNPVRIAVRAWADGAAKPGWQQSIADASSRRISTPGIVRLWGYLSASAALSATVPFSNASTSTVVRPPAPTLTTPPDDDPAPGQPSPAPSASPTPAPSASPSPAPSAVPSPDPSPSPAPPTGGQPSSPPKDPVKPSASTTGVPAGTKLTRYDGDLTITTPGTVISGLDIHGFVTVKAPDVTIKNSIVRGGKARGYALGLITNYGYDNLLIERVDVIAEFPSVYFDGIKGWDFTARGVHVVGNVDSIKIHGDNVLVEKSLLEDTVFYANDPAQGGGSTHNDNIQILRGKNLRIIGNTIRGATNFAILGGAEQDDVTLTVDGNWIDGGHCSLKLQTRKGWSQTATVTNNKFGPNRVVSSCPFTAYPAVSLTQSGNVMELTGTVVSALLLVS